MTTGILGIDNRTENWRTALLYRERLATNAAVNFAREVLKATNEDAANLSPNTVHVELFWKGFRDLRHQLGGRETDRQAVSLYRTHFPRLRERVGGFQTLASLKEQNYVVDDARQDQFISNLRNSEIDIVISTPTHLLVGEAKYSQNFGADSRHILVHQLVRQFVMATIVASLTSKCNVKVIPFVISCESPRNRAQVGFMIDQGWLSPANLFDWSLNRYTERKDAS